MRDLFYSMLLCLIVSMASRHHIVIPAYSLGNLTQHVGSLPTLLADDVLTVSNVTVDGKNMVTVKMQYSIDH